MTHLRTAGDTSFQELGGGGPAEVRAGELAGELDRIRLALRVERSRASWGPVAGALLLLILALLSLVLVMATRLRRARVDAELHALTIEQPARVDQLT